MEKRIGVATALLALALVGVPAAMAAPVAIGVTDESGKALSGDPDQGAIVFHKCQVCHSIKPGENHIGPTLNGVIGRTAGTVPGFNYSPANKSSGIVWTEQKVYTYLLKPQAMVPGTKMSFPGLPAPQERADLIAFLKANSK